MDEAEDEGVYSVISVPVDIEFYLKRRDDPYQVQADVELPAGLVAEGAEEVMTSISMHFDEMMNTKDAFRVILRNPLGGAQLVILEEVQAISIHAVTEETIQRLLEEHHAE